MYPKRCFMAAIRHYSRICLSPEDRAALARLARGTDRLAYRAKGILLLAEGMAKAAVARRLHVGQNAVRQWEKRWLAGGGAESLKRRGGRVANWRGNAPVVPNLPVRLPAVEAELLRREPSGRGRPVSVRTSIEAWVRDAASLGLAPPGARLPPQNWFVRHFHASPPTVAAAFTSLERQGFVRNRRRIGSFMADTPPFAKRYLLVIARAGQGLDHALEAAAHEQEGRLGVRWEIFRWLSSDAPYNSALQADIASQRWAGVFLRMSPSEDLPGWEFMRLDRTPISGRIHDLPFHGEHVITLAHDANCSEDPWQGSFDAALATLRANGRRHPLVIDAVADYLAGRREEYARRKAATYGLEIPEACYLLLDFHHDEQIHTILATAMHVAEWKKIDSVAILQDNFAVPTCDALARHFGAKAASRLHIAAIGNKPVLPATCLPVTWHGLDLAASLDSFVDWCDAIHAGVKAPPPPELFLF